jgi:tRNA1Val (adenine37-N6)-methyltransferase
MKVGTDGVLLGAWVNLKNENTILEIGTGSGVIALVLAQRTPPHTHIDAIEPDQPSCLDASDNFSSCPWKDRLSLHHTRLQDFQSKNLFDLIISNPPYFHDSQKPPDSRRELARHTESLSFTDLLEGADRLLTPTGRLAIILPVTEATQFKQLALPRFQVIRTCQFRSRKHKPVERILFEFSRLSQVEKEEVLTLYEEGDRWTKEYDNLTQSFYLTR